MKKINLLIALTFLFLQSFSVGSKNLIKINKNQTTEREVTVISSTETTTILKYKFNAYTLHKVNTPRGFANVITSPEATKLLKEGAPDLPKFANSIIISDTKNTEISILKSAYIEIENINIAPSKGNLTRNINPSDISYNYGEEYNQDAFYPANLARLRTPYILRDFRGQTVVVQPFQYNPITKVLRIYTDVTVKVSATNEIGTNFLKKTVKNNKKISCEFTEVYKQHFLNYSTNSAKYTSQTEEGNMLIICHSDYMTAMQDFVSWKNQKGMQTELVEYSTIGNSANDIDTYVNDYYTENSLTFLLLVGDGQHIPSLYSSGDSDAAYGYVLGDDHYAEIFVGRFSAESIADVETQVKRSIDYEKEPQINDFYQKHTLIASNENGGGSGDDGEADYEHMQNIRTDLLGYTYTEGDEFYDGNQGGNDATGNPDVAMITEALNEGRGFISYIGHGSDYSFVTSGFDVNDVDNLVNVDKLPFIFDVACVNGNFHNQTCFAESWLRATYGDKPTGAIAIIASTINQSWAPPMSAQDEMVDIMVESYEDNIKRTFGGITINGCMLMNDEYGNGGDAMTDTWTIFGDPSLMIRTATPTDIQALYTPIISIGDNQFTVTSENENALVALTIDNEIIGTAKIENGIATINFETINNPSIVKLTITAYNKIPHFAEIPVISSTTAYLTLDNYTINDENNNEQIDFNENLTIDFSVKNIGILTANNVIVELSTEDEFITINESQYTLGNIETNEIIEQENIFDISIANNVEDGHNALFNLVFTDDLDSTWTSNFILTLNAPELNMSFEGINDENENNNNRLDSDETLDLNLIIENIGHADLENAICTLSCESEFITINTNELDFIEFNQNTSFAPNFSISIDENTPIATEVTFNFHLSGGAYEFDLSLDLVVNLMVEDWESVSFSSYEWEFEGNTDWTLSTESYEGVFSAKSGNISESQSSSLKLNINVLTDGEISFFKKVSSEANYDFLNFYIDNELKGNWSGLEDWSEVSFPVLVGEHTFRWEYAKDNYQSYGEDCAWIDNIILPKHEILSVNTAPTFSSEPITNINAYEEYNYTITANDIDNDFLTISCLEKPEWLDLETYNNNDITAVLTGTPTNENSGNHIVRLKLSDNINEDVIQEFTINVASDFSNIETMNMNSLNIYPSPAKENFTISYGKHLKNVKIELFNMNGQQVLDKNLTNNVTKINIENLSSGTYIVHIISENKIIEKDKLIKD